MGRTMKSPKIIGLWATALVLSSAVAHAAAADNWKQHCASCHGDDGAGQTKMGRKLGAKDLKDPAYQKTFTDDQLFKNLKEGETGADGKVKMKPFADKLSDDDIKALVGYVRSLAK
jgi:mono/diheme cytochrome c family protein